MEKVFGNVTNSTVNGRPMMIARALACLMLIASLTLISDSRSNAAVPAAEKVYEVNSDGDEPDVNLGDGICATSFGKCTFRAAIENANQDGLPSRITFASQMTISIDPFNSVYGFGYGLAEDYTVIDASDRWDGSWPEGHPGVNIIDNRYTLGLLLIQGDYAIVRGIEFTGGGNKGIVVDGSKGTIIGGTNPKQRNVFSITEDAGYPSIGVEISGGSSKTDVRGNYFGTRDGQNAFLTPGEYGVYLTNGDNTVRDNLIVGHSEAGILSWIEGHNLIIDNIIGADADKISAIPNRIGIALNFSDENQIGPGNYISKNSQEGILIDHSDNNLVMGNRISSNGNHGINIVSSLANRIGLYFDNVIKVNTGNGINIDHGHNTQVIFNSICSNTEAGIYLTDSQNNIIGGPLDNQRNYISGGGTHGVHLDSGAHNNAVSGNYIGLGSLSTPDCGVSNQKHGVLIENGASDNHIGGLEPGEGNWIGYNHQSGIYLTGSGTTGNVVEGNVIGADLDWYQEAPNSNHGIGIYDGANGNWIGWFNTILASGWSGIAIVNSSNNVVWFNNIGTDGADINWGNQYYGVHVVNSPGNQIASNRIHNNGIHDEEAGVRIQDTGSINNFISLNSITNNGGLGIELFNGANYSQPAPVIHSGSCSTAVSGVAFPGSIVEIFSDGAEEGRYFEASINADASTGAFSWNGNPAGPNLTATASDVFLGSTSQFSAAYPIGVCNNPPIAAFTFSPNDVNRCTSITFDASTSSDVEDATQDLQVRWDWGNDGTFDTGWSVQKVIGHKFPYSGLHAVRMEVKDSEGLTSSTTRQVTITTGTCGGTYLPLIIR